LETRFNFSCRKEFAVIAAVLFSAFAVRFLLFPIQGHWYDIQLIEKWTWVATEQGIRGFYRNVWSDYPPFNIYLFAGSGAAAKLLGVYGEATLATLVKLVPTLFDLATAGLIYYFVRKHSSFKVGLIAAALYAFNPATIFNVSIWGQQDAIYTFFVVFSLVLAFEGKSKAKYSAASFALAILTKPQAIAFAPLLVFLIYKKNGLKTVFSSTIAFALTALFVLLPFNWDNLWTFLTQIYFGAYNTFQFTSLNAFNMWGIGGLFVPDGNLYIVGWALFAALAVGVLYSLKKHYYVSDESFVIFCAFVLFFGFFMLPTRIHERYLFPTISLLALAIPFIKKARPIFMVLTATFLFNQAYVLHFILLDKQSPPSGDVFVLLFSIINTVTFVYTLILMVRGLNVRFLNSKISSRIEKNRFFNNKIIKKVREILT
jgi:Gpi18-like mannosyltransferase